MIDLRSDTLTRPTDAMRAAMARAEVGDDVYGEDPTVRALEERVAGLFGHEAALFTPTGSMANVLAVRVAGRRRPGGALRGLAPTSPAPSSAPTAPYTGLTMRTWTHPRGQVDLAAIRGDVRPRHGAVLRAAPRRSRSRTPTTSPAARCSRSTDLRGAARVRRPASASACTSTAPGSGTPTSPPASRWRSTARCADVLAVCLSKGLGAPVGSLVVGTADAIAEARVWRKRMGGGMRQVGILAAAGLHALDHHVERLADDHAHARLLAEACGVDPATRATPTSSWSTCPTPPAFVAAAARGRACWSSRGRPTRRAAGHPPRRQPRRRRRRPRAVLSEGARDDRSAGVTRPATGDPGRARRAARRRRCAPAGSSSRPPASSTRSRWRSTRPARPDLVQPELPARKVARRRRGPRALLAGAWQAEAGSTCAPPPW